MTPDLYKLKTPDKGEELLRFVVVEDRGERVLVREVTLFVDWPIPPQEVLPKSEIVPA
jgi:hypothetical protein